MIKISKISRTQSLKDIRSYKNWLEIFFFKFYKFLGLFYELHFTRWDIFKISEKDLRHKKKKVFC